MLKHLSLIFLLGVSGVATWLVLDSMRARSPLEAGASEDGSPDQMGSGGPSGQGTRSDRGPGKRGGARSDGNRKNAALADSDRKRPGRNQRSPGSASAAEAPELVVYEERGALGTILEGGVLTPSGTPLADTIVSLLRNDPNSPLGSKKLRLIREPVTTDASGFYRFDELEGGLGYAVRVEHGSYASQENLGVDVEKGQTIRLPDFRLGSGATISGFILQADGNVAIAGAVVSASSLTRGGDDLGNSIVRQSITDKDGSFKLPNMATGVYTVIASSKNFATQRSSPIQLTEANQQHKMTLSLAKGFSIHGTATIVGGEPASNVAIEVSPVGNSKAPPVHINARRSGVFSAAGLAKGNYRIRASAPGYHCPDTTVAAGAKGITITLRPLSGVSGYLVAKDTGDPLKSFGLQVWSASKNDNPSHLVGDMRTFRSEDGSFTIESLDPGRYMVKAFHNDYRPTWSPAFDLRRVFVHGLAIEMERGASLRGTIVDSRGDPVASAKVSIMENNYRESPLAGLLYGKEAKLGSARTDAEGVFEFERLMPGTYQVRVDAPDMVTLYHRDIVVQDELESDTGALQLSPGGTIVVAVIDGRGVAAKGAKVHVRSPDGDSWDSVANVEGEATFEHLVAGTYDVLVVHVPPGQPGMVLAAGVTAEKTKQSVQVIDGVSQKVFFNVP